MNKKAQAEVLIPIIVFAVFVGVIVLLLSMTVVPAGKEGVYDLFGKVKDKELQPGFHLVHPFARVTDMSVKTQEYTMSYIEGEGAVKGSDIISALTKEGLAVDLDITVLYHLEAGTPSDIYKTIGRDYVGVIVRPQIRSAIREVVAKYEAKKIYSEERKAVEQQIYNVLEGVLSERGIVLEAVLLRHVQLPKTLSEAIELKLTAEQSIEQKRFDVLTEMEEANRKRVEARGIADANDIIAKSLTTEYLTWYWIENLENHESVIYVPIGNTGLPLFKEINS